LCVDQSCVFGRVWSEALDGWSYLVLWDERAQGRRYRQAECDYNDGGAADDRRKEANEAGQLGTLRSVCAIEQGIVN
jgi:hypothetical protein